MTESIAIRACSKDKSLVAQNQLFLPDQIYHQMPRNSHGWAIPDCPLQKLVKARIQPDKRFNIFPTNWLIQIKRNRKSIFKKMKLVSSFFIIILFVLFTLLFFFCNLCRSEKGMGQLFRNAFFRFRRIWHSNKEDNIGI